MEIRYLFKVVHSITLIVFLSSIRSLAQNANAITSMHTYLQQHADSTIIFKYTSNWITAPLEFKIISKKGDTITRYIYKSTEKLPKMPKSIRDTLSKIHKPLDPRSEYVKLHSVGINKFFNALYTDDKSIKAFWRELQNLSPWTLNDDSIEGEGCPGQVDQIYDGGGISLFLITKQGVKQLYFYAPYFYDKICPGKKGRQAILSIEKVFNKYFN